MEFRFNIRKSHFIVILVLLVVVGFGIAQTPPNPGHTASQVNIGGSINSNLESWANSANSQISNHETRITSLESSRWIPVTGGSSPLCWPNAGGTCNLGTTGQTITSPIPLSAKEVLVHAWFESGQSGVIITATVTPKYFDIYTQEGSTRYSHRLFASYGNSADFWLPVTSDRTVYMELVGGSITGNPRSGLQFIGYR